MDLILPIALAVMMLGVGVNLTLSDFVALLSKPSALLAGSFAQMVMLPLMGVIVAVIFSLPPAYAIGILIVTFCPGGVTSNYITLLVRGDVALSVSLTLLSSLITPFSLPVLTSLALWVYGQVTELPELDTAAAILQLVLITLAPIVLGMLLNTKYPHLTGLIRRPLKGLSLLCFIVMVGAVTLQSWPTLTLGLVFNTAPAVIALVILAMFCGVGIAQLTGLRRQQQVTLAIEVGIQNAATALFVTRMLLNNADMATSALVYGIVMQIPVLGFLGYKAWKGRLLAD